MIALTREEISQARLNTIRGIENLDRLDESLYQDFETEDMRKARSRPALYLLMFAECMPAISASQQWLTKGGLLQKRMAKEAKEHEKLKKAAEKVRSITVQDELPVQVLSFCV